MTQDACDGLVLCEQVLLDHFGFLEHRLGILVRLFGTLVGGPSLDVLADDDDRQQHKLQEAAREPHNDVVGALFDRVGQGGTTPAP